MEADLCQITRGLYSGPTRLQTLSKLNLLKTVCLKLLGCATRIGRCSRMLSSRRSLTEGHTCGGDYVVSLTGSGARFSSSLTAACKLLRTCGFAWMPRALSVWRKLGMIKVRRKRPWRPTLTLTPTRTPTWTRTPTTAVDGLSTECLPP